MARGGPSSEVAALLEEVCDGDAQVSFFQGDVSVQADVASVLERIDATLPPLRGVFHLAGVFNDGVIERLDEERFLSVLAPKVTGGWNLHLLTKGHLLDHFVLFSSGASFLGATGLANYAAANAFLDALAVYRRRRNLPGVSIAWGPWERTGMADAVGRGREAQWRRGGLETMPVEAALEVMERILSAEAPNPAVLPVDWKLFDDSMGTRATPPLFADLIAEARSSGEVRRQAESGDSGRRPVAPLLDVDSVLGLSEADRTNYVQELLLREAAGELGMRPADLDPDRPLTSLGLDSLMAVQLKNRIQAALGVGLPMSRFVSGMGVSDLTLEVLASLDTGGLDSGGSASTRPRAALDDTEGMDDERVTELLKKLLAEGTET